MTGMAFKTIDENETVVNEAAVNHTPEQRVVANQKVYMNDEAVSAFAQGLPGWDIIPPQVMVRRR